ncbi:MAG: hypothetical protein JWQ97_2742 [Phenylobacterium sp.]|jgi:hypothetical protein|nr:hypothetical protein [Phenylobacterium sp.]
MDFGSYTVTQVFLVVWRWRLSDALGGETGLSISLAAARFAARGRIRRVREARAAAGSGRDAA